ncbi:MAG: hypothetical protein ACREAC_06215, partial [Blastocatellia bacterium]
MAKSKKSARQMKSRAENSGKQAKPGTQGKGRDWKREEYLIPPDRILRAAKDLLSRATPSQIDDFAGRMFALQDMVDNEELDKIALIEKESDEPAFIEIVRAVRREAERALNQKDGSDPEYARSIAGVFIDHAFSMDSATLPVWFRYQNRMRKRRVDAGLGLIDPPD